MAAVIGIRERALTAHEQTTLRAREVSKRGGVNGQAGRPTPVEGLCHHDCSPRRSRSDCLARRTRSDNPMNESAAPVIRSERGNAPSTVKVLAITLVALASTGCSLTLMAPVVIDGQVFATERADKLRPGMTTTEAEALLGAPLRHRTVKETTVWAYEMRRRLRECRFYLGPIPLQSARSESFGLELVFDSAGLESAVYREERPDMKTERILVGAGVGISRR